MRKSVTAQSKRSDLANNCLLNSGRILQIFRASVWGPQHTRAAVPAAMPQVCLCPTASFEKFPAGGDAWPNLGRCCFFFRSCKSCRSRRELCNGPSFEKIDVDTAENEPSKCGCGVSSAYRPQNLCLQGPGAMVGGCHFKRLRSV